MYVSIVTVSELTPWHGSEYSVRAFSSSKKAEAWIESQIAAIVEENNLDRDTAVDGGFVELSRDRSVQFNIHEENVL